MSRYSRGPSITRQLTEDEEALDRRSSAFLQSESVMPQAFGSGGQRYAWMEKDLKMRAMQAGVLKQEGDLATDLGDKRALAVQDTKIMKEDAEALRGLDEVEKKVAKGMDYNEAIRETSKGMNLGLNETFHKASAERAQGFETPEAKKLRIAKQELETLGVEKDTWNAETFRDAMMGDTQKAEAVKMLQQKWEAEGITAENSPVAAKLKAGLDQLQLAETDDRIAQWKTLGNGAGDDLVRLTHSFDEVGLGGVTHPDRTVKAFNDSPLVLAALADKEFLKKSLPNPEEMTKFSTALNVLTDDSMESTEAEKRQARSIIYSFAGKREASVQAALKEKALGEEKRKLADTVFKDDEEFGKQVKGILEMKSDGFDGKTADSVKSTQLGLLRDSGLAAIRRARVAAGLDPSASAAEEEAISALKGSPDQVASGVRAEVAKFASSLARPAAKAPEDKPAPKGAQAAKPDVRQGSTVFTWNGEKYVPKQ